MTVRIDDATAEDADAVVEMWVSLAAGQRSHGSHLRAQDNRKQIRDAVARHMVLDGLRVARCVGDDEPASSGKDGSTSADKDTSASAGEKASADQELAGFVMFGLETGAYAQDVSRGIVRNLYVRPTYRDSGVGESLLTAAEDALEAAGAEIVSLEAMAGNDRARSFYAEHGYAPHRIEFEKALDAVDRNDTHSRED